MDACFTVDHLLCRSSATAIDSVHDEIMFSYPPPTPTKYVVKNQNKKSLCLIFI